jgi:branched-chain amino acid transport system permease protein
MRRLLPWALLATATAALAVVAPFADRYTLFILYFFLLNVALAQSWNLIGGYTGLISLGHAAFLGIGAYTTAILVVNFGAPTVFAFICGGVAAAIFALVISFATFRFRDIYFATGTLVLAEALRIWMINWEFIGGAQGMQFPPGVGPDLYGYYYLMLGLAAGSTAVLLLIMRTKLGLGLRAIRDNENSARNMGVNVFATKLVAFLVCAFIAGLVGAVHAGRLGTIEPYSIFGAAWTIGIVNIVIIGGIGTIVGPIIGAMFTIALSEAFADLPSLHLIIEGVILILVIRFAPLGIWGYGLIAAQRAPALHRIMAPFCRPLDKLPR